jgi:zinc D-Ala-D-Ala carboxypeptidase
MNLTPNFSLAEMVASQEAARRGIDNTPDMATQTELQKTAELLEKVRARLERPILVSSGYRCPTLNRAVNGAPNSAHLWGGACDFTSPGYGHPLEVARELATYAEALDYDQLIYEFGAWVHIGRAKPGERARRQVLTIDRTGTRVGL